MVGTEGFFVECFVGGGVADGFWLVLGSCGVVDYVGKTGKDMCDLGVVISSH